eukprot:TRINITY_DN5712_c1_g2_i2.p1 TRINITY_DN5712_c1_g2~~TRINITY_DN5712_c1_g2_i2.p1  ORF type:complete len:878 (+),score=194.59 TRINITY_DN5712_c1_g2_i2:105-2636(+)
MGATQGRPSDGRREKTESRRKNHFNTCSVFTGHQEIVRCLVAIDTATVASGSDDGRIIVWDIVKRVPKLTMNTVMMDMGDSDSDGDNLSDALLYRPSRRAVKKLLPLTELNVLASCSTNDNRVILWSLITGDILGHLKGHHTGPVTCISPIPGSSHLLATAGADTLICLWTASPAANSIHVPQGEEAVRGVNYRHPSPVEVASFMGSTKRIDTTAKWASARDVQFLIALDSTTVITVATNSSKLYCYILPIGKMPKAEMVHDHPHDKEAVITQLIGNPERSEFITGDDKGKIVTWSAKTQSPTRTFTMSKIFKGLVKNLSKEDLCVRSISINNKHNSIAVAAGVMLSILPLPDQLTDDGKKQKADTADALCKSPMAHRVPITQVEWLPASDGQYLITSSEDVDDCTIKVWDTFTKDHRRAVVREASKLTTHSNPKHLDTSRVRSNSNATVAKRSPASTPGGLFRSFLFSSSRSKRTESSGDTSVGGDTPRHSEASVPISLHAAPSQAYRPFRPLLDPNKDVVNELDAHTDRVTNIATIPTTGMGFMSSSNDKTVVFWTVGAYFDARAMEAARMQRQQDIPGGDWPTWDNAYKWKMSCDADCEWLSRGCELELRNRIRIVGLSEEARSIPAPGKLNRIPTTLSLLGSLTDISPLYQNASPDPSASIPSPADSLLPSRILKMGSGSGTNSQDKDSRSIPGSPSVLGISGQNNQQRSSGTTIEQEGSSGGDSQRQSQSADILAQWTAGIHDGGKGSRGSATRWLHADAPKRQTSIAADHSSRNSTGLGGILPPSSDGPVRKGMMSQDSPPPADRRSSGAPRIDDYFSSIPDEPGSTLALSPLQEMD